MSFSVKRSVVKSFNFNGKHVGSVYVKGVGQCLVSKDVYEAIGYQKKDGAKSIQWLVPEKYKIGLGDAQVDLEGADNSVLTQPNTLLLKEPGLYCFLSRCKTDEAQLFTEWVVETVLPREVRKLASTIEEKDAVIALMNDNLQGHDDQIQAIKYENVALQAQKDVGYKSWVKLRWFDRHFPDHEIIVEIDNPNSIHAFNRYEEEVMQIEDTTILY